VGWRVSSGVEPYSPCSPGSMDCTSALHAESRAESKMKKMQIVGTALGRTKSLSRTPRGSPIDANKGSDGWLGAVWFEKKKKKKSDEAVGNCSGWMDSLMPPSHPVRLA